MLLYRVRRGRRTYFRLRKKGRVNGHVVNTVDLYLGTEEEIIRRLTDPEAVFGGVEVTTFPFGTTAAFLAADHELGFSATVEAVTGSPTTAQTLFAFIAGRAHEPVSKNGMAAWADRSLLRFRGDRPSLSSRAYLHHMDKLTDPVLERITEQLGTQLVRQGHRPSLVFFDPTNFSTEQQPEEDDPDRQLPKPGHAKDGNLQAKLVGLATAVTEEHLPVYHRVYPWNENDARLFPEVVGTMVDQLRKFGAVADELTFVFDKGVNSEDGLAAVHAAEVHFLSSLKRNQVRDLLARARTTYRALYTTEQQETIHGFRSKRRVLGVDGVVVVAFNESARKRQARDYERAKERFLATCHAVAAKMSKAHRGRRSTVQSVTERIEDVLPPKWRGVFKYRVGATLDQDPPRFTVTGWVDPKKEAELKEGFGKTVVVTDRVDWRVDHIVRTYFARSGMEEEFHVLKDVLLMPVMPIFHRRDPRIRVHAFLCVMGLLFYRWIQLRVAETTGERIPIGRLSRWLDEIRVAALLRRGSRRAKVVLEKQDAERARLVKALGLEKFVPN
ncbi:MAG: IS1634 family transposase [Thermoplasmata archaeon]